MRLEIARLSLHKGQWEEGDPKNRLIEIGFANYEGPDLHARQEKMVAEAFGWEDSVTKVTPNKELKEASERARAKLPALRAAFNAGLAPGETIQLKAPFKTITGGKEFMWVEVTSVEQSEDRGPAKE